MSMERTKLGYIFKYIHNVSMFCLYLNCIKLHIRFKKEMASMSDRDIPTTLLGENILKVRTGHIPRKVRKRNMRIKT